MRVTLLPPGIAAVLALLAGLALPFAFAPLEAWPLASLSVFVLYVLLQQRSPRQALLIGWLFGLGYFGVGVSWVYHSLHLFGAAVAPLAAALTALFVLVMTVFPAVVAWSWCRLSDGGTVAPVRAAWLFAALWVLGELLRGKLMGGFPWLLAGYSHTDGPLGTLAPLVGVYGIGFLLVAGSALLWPLSGLGRVTVVSIDQTAAGTPDDTADATDRARAMPDSRAPAAGTTSSGTVGPGAAGPSAAGSGAAGSGAASPSTAGSGAESSGTVGSGMMGSGATSSGAPGRDAPGRDAIGSDTAGSGTRLVGALLSLGLIVAGALSAGAYKPGTDAGDPFRVRLVQANIPQALKFSQERLDTSLRQYTSLSKRDSLDGIDLVVWPETAIPTYFDRVEATLAPFVDEMSAQGVEVLSGGFHREGDRTWNSVRQLGGDKALYRKRHLVPFGEYMPLRFVLEWFAQFIEIPMSDLAEGDGPHVPLELQGQRIGLSICYEDVYGEEMRALLPASTLLVNVSNDAWFGASAAPHQHEQKARMRAREFDRSLVRVTNTGVSSAIRADGSVIGRIAHDTQGVLDVDVQPRQGMTLYARTGNWPVFIVALLVLVAGWLARRRVAGQRRVTVR